MRYKSQFKEELQFVSCSVLFYFVLCKCQFHIYEILLHVQISKAQKAVNLSVFIALLGSVHAKTSRKEMDPWAQFHQFSTLSFYALKAQKRKKDSQVISLSMLSGSTSVKAERKYVGEINPRSSYLFSFSFLAFFCL